MKARLLCAFALVFSFHACSKGGKSNEAPPVGADGKPMITSRSEPEKVVFLATLELPAGHKAKVKKSDIMMWTLINEKGDLVAGQIGPVPQFPHEVKVFAKQIKEPLAQDNHLIFNARIVKFGDERKPPQKGQLVVTLGSVSADERVVENKAVDPVKVEKVMKKLKIEEPKEVTVGQSLRAEFAPSQM